MYRDMQWGQGLQLIEDKATGNGTTPKPLIVEAGEELDLIVKFSRDGAMLQFQVERASVV